MPKHETDFKLEIDSLTRWISTALLCSMFLGKRLKILPIVCEKNLMSTICLQSEQAQALS
jgi:hypothetical protein